MRRITQEYDGTTWERVTKARARKVYESGGRVAFSPVLARWGAWVEPYIGSNNTGRPFDVTVSAVEFYNCNADLGRYLSYYIPEGSSDGMA